MNYITLRSTLVSNPARYRAYTVISIILTSYASHGGARLGNNPDLESGGEIAGIISSQSKG